MLLVVCSFNQFKASPNYAQLPQSHMVARNQPMPYTNTPTAPPTIQQNSTVSPENNILLNLTTLSNSAQTLSLI